MKTRLLPILLCTCLAAGAAEIQQYAARVDLAADGTAQGTASVALSGAPLETVEIPVAFKASGYRLQEAPQGLQLQACDGGVKVTMPAAAGVCRFTFAFSATGVLVREKVLEGRKPDYPRTSRLLRHSFVNTKATPILDYSMVASLPEDYRFQAIKEKSPRMGDTEVEPRVLLGKDDGRQNARLHRSDLKQGDSASMLLEAVPTRHSPLWLLAGLLATVLYLIFFRDLVAAKS
jgi:hypothetical protein